MRARRGAMPVLFARCENHGVAGVEVLSRLALDLDANPAIDDEKPLRPRVDVPVCPGALGECDPVHVHGRAFFARRDERGPGRAGKRPGISRAKQRVLVPENLQDEPQSAI